MATRNPILNSIQKIDPEVLVTAEQLSQKYGSPILDLAALADICKVKERTITQNISLETFPIAVTKINGKWTATAFSVAMYLHSHQRRFVA